LKRSRRGLQTRGKASEKKWRGRGESPPNHKIRGLTQDKTDKKVSVSAGKAKNDKLRSFICYRGYNIEGKETEISKNKIGPDNYLCIKIVMRRRIQTRIG